MIIDDEGYVVHPETEKVMPSIFIGGGNLRISCHLIFTGYKNPAFYERLNPSTMDWTGYSYRVIRYKPVSPTE